MLDEINYVRTKPAEYAQFIDTYLVAEKASAAERKVAEELRQVLLKMKPVEPLSFSPFMYPFAVKHGKWMSRTGKIEHSDFYFNYAENLVGGVENVRHAVIDLLIDHGISSRGHRRNILHPGFRYCAIHEVPGQISYFDFTFIQMFSSEKKPK